jgi:hypothetical protein
MNGMKKRFVRYGMRSSGQVCLMWLFLLVIVMLHSSVASGMETEWMPEAVPQTEVVPDPDMTCSIFIYMCGSNLESKYGLASSNIDELLGAKIPDSTQVIVETGGASNWWSWDGIEADRLQRYIVKDGSLELVMEMENQSMGSPEVFSDFLRWGRENYPADRNILVMWDHGGNAADGVCYDENFDYDCLDRVELMTALKEASLPDKFDLVVLDTCYMGSLETAGIFSDYADYMTASQMVVPGSGMDYRVLAESAASCDMKALGPILCDAYMEKCKLSEQGEEAQLAFYDLSKISPLLHELNEGAGVLKKIHDRVRNSPGLFRGAMRARVSNTSDDANVIDLMRAIDNLTFTPFRRYRDTIRSCMDELVLYQVCGRYANCSGISVYYPITYKKEQVEYYVDNSPANNYSTLLRDIYENLPESMVSFRDSGSIGKDGSFRIELEEGSRDYLNGITCRIWRESEVIPDSYLLLYEEEVKSFDTELGRLFADLSAESTFDGEAYTLDGHLLMLSVKPRELLAVYSAPVKVNGENTFYSFVYPTKLKISDSHLYTMLGNGTDELGLAQRQTRRLESGDEVVTYASLDETGTNLTEKDSFTVGEDGGELGKVPLPAGKYRYQFIVTDIIGRSFGSDYCIYEITEEDGNRKVQAAQVQKKAEEG